MGEGGLIRLSFFRYHVTMVSESGISFRYSEESTGCVNDTLDGCGLSYNNTLQHNQVGDTTN